MQRMWKDCKSQRWQMTQRTDTAGLINMASQSLAHTEDLHSSKQTTSRQWAGRQTPSPTCNQEAPCIDTCWEGNQFSPVTCPWAWSLHTSAGWLLRRCQLIQSGLLAWFALVWFGFSCGLSALFYFGLVVLSYCLNFIYLFIFQRKITWSWMSREVGRIWKDLG